MEDPDSYRTIPVARVSKGASRVPPFEEEHQLVPTQSVDKVDSYTLISERLLRSLHDNDLEIMHNALWYAGRIGNISPLHHQKVLRREIILTENPRLHLVWFEKTIYVQTLQDELLNWQYFSDVVCGDEGLHQAATGFLLSYAHLIQYPSDLDVAKTTGLINKDMSWRGWQNFRSDLLHHCSNRKVHDRFEYGELRLGRLNQIYRIKCLGLTYFTVHRDYSSYFGHNYMTLVTLFALVSVALSAMQVLAGYDNKPAVVAATIYRFAIATLVALAGSCTLLLALYLGLYICNWFLIFARSGRRKLIGADYFYAGSRRQDVMKA
jgi:hypothetical protein